MDWSADPTILRNIYKQTNSDNIFYKLISKEVIAILSPQLIARPHNLIYDDELVHTKLLSQLERFICNLSPEASRDEIDKTFERVRSLKQPTKLCRKVLKTGDVYFSCSDCGFDATCVLCIECFHKSPHKDHNYRMANTNGGGCCDCGDIEAWKQYPACTDHSSSDQPSLSLKDFEVRKLRSQQIQSDKQGILDKLSLLPNGMATRYFLICQACLHYARLMLSWKDFHSLPSFLQLDPEKYPDLAPLLSQDRNKKNYFTVLFNDELHTYDHVINTLVKIIKCTMLTASIMASTVSREGRCLLINDKYDECKRVRDAIAEARDSGQGPLKVEVIHGTVLAHQAFALKLIEWIQKMSLLCDAFRVLTAYTLFGSYDQIEGSDKPEDEPHSLLEKIMVSNTTYWKVARIDWNDLFVTTLLTEYSIKDRFARLITRIYPRLLKDFIDDDHDHAVSILTMTTQLYTVPSLICMLIEEEDALSIIMQALVDACRSNKRETSATSYENRHTYDMTNLKRGFYIISDIRHLINIKPTKWTNVLRKNVIVAIKIFLSLLSSMQGMDSVRRQVGQHLEYELDWETGMTLQDRLISLISRLVTYCSFDDEVLIESLKATQANLFRGNHSKYTTESLFSHEVECIKYDVSVLPVSVHLPLTRFAGALIVELMQRRPCNRIPYDESLVILTDQSDTRRSMIDIIEPALRTQVMVAQFRSGMWRRNGYSLVNQIMYFSSSPMRKEMFDRDILVLQECAATCEANKFIIHLLNKFNLLIWVSSRTTQLFTDPRAPQALIRDEEAMNQTMSLAEEFLQLLLTIVGERYRVGIGKIQEEDVIKNEIIQLLCIGPFTRSKLEKQLYVEDNELDCIKAVANLRRTTESSTGKYELKEEFYERFNPFFYHYNRRYQSHALDVQLKRKKSLKESLICCPPPAPVELTDQFKNLNELLKCDMTLRIVRTILQRTLEQPDPPETHPTKFFASDLQLDQCLHLIGLGLHEQERNLREFLYLEAAYEKDIFSLLKDSYEQAKRSKDLIFWLMNKTSQLINKIELSPFVANLSDQQRLMHSTIRKCFQSTLATCDTITQENKKRNSELAAQRRERIMATMKANQAKFLSNPKTKQLLTETAKHEAPLPGSPSSFALSSQQPSASLSSSPGIVGQATTHSTRGSRNMELRPANAPSAANLNQEVQMDCANDDGEGGPHSASGATADQEDEAMDNESLNMTDESTEPYRIIEPSHSCILCKDEQRVGFDRPTMVLLAYIQRSAVLSKNRIERKIPNYALTPSNQLKYSFLWQRRDQPESRSAKMYSYTSDNSWSFDATFMPADLFFGPYISTCGHVMHLDCWRGFYNAVVKRESQRPNRGVPQVSFELDKNEILCPLCECISNVTIPLLPDYTRFVKRQLESDTSPLGGTVFGIGSSAIERSSDSLTAFLLALRGSVAMFKPIRTVQVDQEDNYIQLLQPKPINDVLEGELNESEAFVLRDFISTMRNEEIRPQMCTKDLLESISKLADRIHSVGLDLDKSISSAHHSRIFMMTSWTISYTIQAQERVARFKGQPILENLESPKNLCLSSLLRFAGSSMMTHESDIMQSLLIRKLRYLLIHEEHLSSSPCCLDIDAFEMFVSLFFLLQRLYSNIKASEINQQQQQKGGSKRSVGSKSENLILQWTTRAYDHEYYRNLLHSMLVLNMLQVIITIQSDMAEEALSRLSVGQEASQDEPEVASDHIQLANFYKDVIVASGHPNSKLPAINDEFINKLQCRLLPFLRACAIFFYHLSQIKPNLTLRKKSAFFEGKYFPRASCEGSKQKGPQQDSGCSTQGNDENSFQPIDPAAARDEFKAICHYLSLPSDFSQLLKSRETRQLACTWLRHSRVLLLIKSALKIREEEIAESSGKMKTSVAAAPAPEGVSNETRRRRTGAGLKRASLSSSSISSGSSASPGGSELMPVRLVRQPHSVNRLINLPYDYSELVDKVSNFTCPSIRNEDSRTPTMCLVCGVMLCSQSYCCQRDLNDLASNYQLAVQRQEEIRQMGAAAYASSGGAGGAPSGSARDQHQQPIQVQAHSLSLGGLGAAAVVSLFSSAGTRMSQPPEERLAPFSSSSSSAMSHPMIHQQLVGSCTYHAHECSGGVGVFLRIRNCQILLLSGRTKGCYIEPPYIDDHGETDLGLRRGNPLHLNRDHYERLQNMWANHAIPEQISRILEHTNQASINWHLH